MLVRIYRIGTLMTLVIRGCQFALGTVLNINGYNYVVADRMAPGIHGVVDIFVDSYDEAINFGRQYGEVYVVA